MTPNLEEFLGPIEACDCAELNGWNTTIKVISQGTVKWKIQDLYGTVCSLKTLSFVDHATTYIHHTYRMQVWDYSPSNPLSSRTKSKQSTNKLPSADALYVLHANLGSKVTKAQGTLHRSSCLRPSLSQRPPAWH
jgi:hypothetical protein